MPAIGLVRRVEQCKTYRFGVIGVLHKAYQSSTVPAIELFRRYIGTRLVGSGSKVRAPVG